MDNTNGGRKHRKKISNSVKRAVYSRDGWACRYCGRQFDQTQTWSEKTVAPYVRDERLSYIFLELDHITPLHHGGDNSPENLAAACAPCNRAKSFNLPKGQAD